MCYSKVVLKAKSSNLYQILKITLITYALQYPINFFKVIKSISPSEGSSVICNAFRWTFITCLASLCRYRITISYQLFTKQQNFGWLVVLGLNATLTAKVISSVFILGRGIAGIPHFCKKSPKLSYTVRDKSPTLNHVAIIFKVKLIFHTNGR